MLIRALAVLLFLWPGLAMSQTYPQPISDTVNDFAGLLTSDQEADLSEKIRALRKDTKVHLVIATFRSRAELGFGSTALEPFATGLFNNWGIGDDRRNDGILVLVLSGDREMRVELGAGFPASFDKVAQEIIDNEFLPAFREGAYGMGIKAGTSAVITYIGRALNSPAQPLYKPSSGGGMMLFWLPFAAIGGVIAFLVAKTLPMFQRCPKCNHRGLHRSAVTLDYPTETLPGREEVTVTCPACDYRNVYVRTLSPRGRDRSSRSSGSGFGGGHSSGGGASGRW